MKGLLKSKLITNGKTKCERKNNFVILGLNRDAKTNKKLTNRLSLRTVKTKFYYICNLMMWMQISFVTWAALNTLHVTRLPSPFWKL